MTCGRISSKLKIMKLLHNDCAYINFRDWRVWLATWGGSGMIKWAPGTFGTVAALPFVYLILFYGGALALFLFACLTFALGLMIAKPMEAQTNKKDSSIIVIDEVAGMAVAALPALLTPFYFIAAFLLFRFFDVLKPWPIGWLDQYFKGPFGVMIDDVIAGIFAALILLGMRYAGIGF